jgi:hypothetical protein
MRDEFLQQRRLSTVGTRYTGYKFQRIKKAKKKKKINKSARDAIA